LLPRGQDCKTSGCYYHLIQLDDGVPTEPFSFEGTGSILIFSSPVDVPFQGFPDRYSTVVVETPTKSLLNLSLPAKGRPLIINVLSAGDAKIIPCFR
jgi:hypothetical protein